MTVPHDRPSARELIEAVREYLERDVMTTTEGRVRFHARVAINVLAMVDRELAEGPAMVAEHRRRLDELGFADDAELARAIRAGEVDDRWEDVFRAVFESVVEKVRVANPDYLEGDESKG
jgi:hypothetical protein